MQQLSKRLCAVGALVTAGNRLADIGTDHAYLPIRLVQEGRIPCALAMDVREGPLSRARKHVRDQELESLIEVRKSDGLADLAMDEADSVIMAGMGGLLMIRILEDARIHWEEIREWILQPQSMVGEVRRFLMESGFRIVDEDIVEEDGKYYPIMRVLRSTGPVTDREWTKAECQFGRYLLENRHPVLLRYLFREKSQCEKVLDTVSHGNGGKSRQRAAELVAYEDIIGEALSYYEMRGDHTETE